MNSLLRWTDLFIGLAKKFIWVFLYNIMEKPEWTFGPTQYNKQICWNVMKKQAMKLFIGLQ